MDLHAGPGPDGDDDVLALTGAAVSPPMEVSTREEIFLRKLRPNDLDRDEGYPRLTAAIQYIGPQVAKGHESLFRRLVAEFEQDNLGTEARAYLVEAMIPGLGRFGELFLQCAGGRARELVLDILEDPSLSPSLRGRAAPGFGLVGNDVVAAERLVALYNRTVTAPDWDPSGQPAELAFMLLRLFRNATGDALAVIRAAAPAPGFEEITSRMLPRGEQATSSG